MAKAQAVSERNLQLGLFLLRITTGLFFLAWAIDKFVDPAHTVKLFSKYYFMSITPQISYIVGVVQVAVIVAFMLGVYKTWSTSFLMVMHGLVVLATWEKLLFPYSTQGLTFWAAVPVLAGLLLLFMMRDSDRMYSLNIGK